MVGELCALGSAAFWASSSVLLRAASYHLSPLAVNAFRCLFATAFFGLLWPFFGQTEQASALSVGYLLASALLALGVGDTLYIKSLSVIGVARALPISGSYPLLTLVLAGALLEERVTWPMAVGTVLVLSGVYLVAVPGRGVAAPKANTQGVLLALGAALTWAFSAGLLKLGLAEVDPVSANALRMALVALMLLGFLHWREGGFSLRRYPRRSLALVGLGGGLGTGLSGLLFLTAVRYAGVAKTAALSSSYPLFGALLAALFLGEKLTLRVMVGASLSVAGVWLLF